jgi:hypothetical protein
MKTWILSLILLTVFPFHALDLPLIRLCVRRLMPALDASDFVALLMR